MLRALLLALTLSTGVAAASAADAQTFSSVVRDNGLHDRLAEMLEGQASGVLHILNRGGVEHPEEVVFMTNGNEYHTYFTCKAHECDAYSLLLVLGPDDGVYLRVGSREINGGYALLGEPPAEIVEFMRGR